MGTSEIYAALTLILRDVFGDDTIVAEPDLTAGRIRQWDSLHNLRLVLTVEKTFQLTFTAAEIGNLRNIGDLVRLIQARTGQAAETTAPQN